MAEGTPHRTPHRTPQRNPRTRDALAAALLALACLLTPCAVLAAWAAHDLADTTRYVRTVAPLATDPNVRDAVAEAVGDQVVRELDARSTDSAATLGPFVRDALHSFTRTDAFRTAWEAGNRAVHDALLHALRDDATTRGPVTVDLAPVTAQVKQRLEADRMPYAHRIPVQHTEVPVVPADEVAGLRRGYRLLETAALWLPLTAVTLAVTGVALAVSRRRVLTAAGLGTALGGALLALAVALGRRLTLTDLPDAVHRPAAAAVYDALTATLRTASWLLLVVGAAAALLTWLSGVPARRRDRLRTAGAPDPAHTPAPTGART
ncbi:hypothetical protein LRR80_06698 [Streptomyces sp. RO-S4]|uniref:hypothetical protein n=1 Tax=unclassified Streptomyces TaxID=2593676 RepID=UPI00208FF40D|nr:MULTISPECIES: hypothetical protein [unclassified Streptomyces]MCO4700588.1 hypothetical protein [Streptomyces sp. RO-S4]